MTGNGARAALPLAAWLLMALLTAGWLAASVQIRTDPSALMPRAASDEQRLLLDLAGQGPAARLILIGISGGTEGERAAASDAMRTSLRVSGRFRQVENRSRIADPAQLRILFGYRYLLSDPDPRRYSEAGLRSELQRRLRELQSPLSSLYARWLGSDPGSEMLRLETSLGSAWGDTGIRQGPEGVWISASGDTSLLLAETQAAGMALEQQRQAVVAVQDAFAAAPGAADLRLALTGAPVLAVAAERRIRSESNRLSLAAVALVCIIVLAGYRSWRALLYAAIPLFSALLAGAAVLHLVYGEIQGITLALGAVLLGICIDYPLHLFSHRQGAGSPVGRVLRIGALSTLLGFAPLLFSGFVALEQLALLVGVGVLTALTLTLGLLPRLPGVSALEARSPWGWPNHRKAGVWRRLLPLGLGVAACLWLALGDRQIWENDIGALSPIPRVDLEQDRRLRSMLGAPEVGRMLVVQGPDLETVLRRAESLQPELDRMQADGLIASVQSVSGLLPSAARQAERQAGLPAAESVRGSLERAAAELPFKPGTFEPFLTDLAAARSLAPLTIEQWRGTPIGLWIESLLGFRDGRWTLLMPLAGIADPAALEARLQAYRGRGVRYLDLRAETSRLVADFRGRALRLLAMGALVILASLALMLRSFPLALRIVAPVLLALVLDLVLLLVNGERLSLFHLMSLLLVMGIGLDYSLFAHLATADPGQRRATAHALTLCAASTIAVFGLLGWSEIGVLHAIGMTVAAGVLLSYVLSFLGAATAGTNRTA